MADLNDLCALLAALATCCDNPTCTGCGTCVTPWLDWIYRATNEEIIEQIHLVRIRAAQVHETRIRRERRANERAAAQLSALPR